MPRSHQPPLELPCQCESSGMGKNCKIALELRGLRFNVYNKGKFVISYEMNKQQMVQIRDWLDTAIKELP